MSSGGRGSLLPNPLRSFKCEACETWCNTYAIWANHLSSDNHQLSVKSSPNNPHSHENWRDDSIRDKCLIVSGVKNLPVSVLVHYLSRFGCLLDIVRQQDKSEGPVDFYFIRYEQEESVMKVLAAQSRVPHQIQGQQIYFRRKYERASQGQESFFYQQRSDGQFKNGQSRAGGTLGNRSGLGALASVYRDESESALGSLQSTYGEESDKEEDEVETHDLFSLKMTEYMATNLSHLKLEDQLEGFCEKILLSKPFLEGRFKLIQELQGILKNTYPNCAIYPCGPDFIGIGNSDDAVNVFVDLYDNQLEKSPSGKSSKNHISEIFKILKQYEDKYQFCLNLSEKTGDLGNASIPILTFTHLYSQVKCNIRTEGYPIVQESMLIKFMCTLDPRVHTLLILVRYWSSFNKIFDSPNEETRNRLLILLMMFHLANRKIIPSLSHLQSLEHPVKIFEKMDIGFCGETSKVPANQMKVLLEDKSIRTLSTLSLLKDFFERFAVANFKDNAICLWPGKFVQKTHLKSGQEETLDEDFAKKLRIAADGSVIMSSMNTESPICIQDFFDMTLNLGSKITAEDLKAFQMSCWKTGEKLEKIINSGKPYLMDMFIESTEKLLKEISDSNECTIISESEMPSSSSVVVSSEVVNAHVKERQEQRERSGQKAESSNGRISRESEKYDKQYKIRTQQKVQVEEDEMPSIEWEDFARKLDKPSSFLTSIRNSARKPVAPVAPSHREYNVSSHLYNLTHQQMGSNNAAPGMPMMGMAAQPPMRYGAGAPGISTMGMAAQPPMRYGPGTPAGMSMMGMVARPPMRYDAGGCPPGAMHNAMMMRGPSLYPQPQSSSHAGDQYSMEIESGSGDDDSEDDSSSEEDEDDNGAGGSNPNSKTMAMKKITLNKWAKDFFIRAVQSEDFSYGIKGKLQSLYKQFMMDFNNRFWSKCLGFEIELDPPYQSVVVADYAKFDDRKSQTRKQRMNTVPTYEESYSLKFYCQSKPVMNRVLNARRNDFLNGKFTRRQIGPLLTLLMDDGIGQNHGGMMQSVAPADRLRLKVQFNVQLDYQDLKQDCHPFSRIQFEDCGSMSMGSANMPKLRFLGSCFNRMAVKFVNYSFRRWLNSCADFDLVAAERAEIRERSERGRERNLLLKAQGKGKMSRRKRERKEKKERKKAQAMQEQDERRIGGSMGGGGGGGGGRGRNFQVPASWNRSMEYDGKYNPRRPFPR